jgi:nicotinate phosphoribosyltransferase
MNPVLFTDRYQLTMLAAYAKSGLAERRAVFELFVRKLPPSRRYLVACGIGRAVTALSALSFGADALSRLSNDAVLGPVLADPVVAKLFRDFRFRGRVLAIPEGRICFPGEPLLRVEGTLAEAQLVETLLLSIVNHDTRVASKASRISRAAAGRPCMEFGTRRTHEVAAVDAARAAYVAGFAGTSNEEAGHRYGVPVLGTMAHSFVLAHAADGGEEGEIAAFREFSGVFPASTLLVDTFDPLRGVRRAVETSATLGGIRLDSGDLEMLSREARSILDQAGKKDTRIIASDDLDEHRIDAMVRGGVPVDGFGVGTMVVATPDAPTLGGVYKLVAIEDARGEMVAVQKKATAKGSSAAPKQVIRRPGSLQDLLVVDGEDVEGEALLVPVMEKGAPVGDFSLEAARRRHLDDLGRASEELRSFAPRQEHERHPLTVSERLASIWARVAEEGLSKL